MKIEKKDIMSNGKKNNGDTEHGLEAFREYDFWDSVHYSLCDVQADFAQIPLAMKEYCVEDEEMPPVFDRLLKAIDEALDIAGKKTKEALSKAKKETEEDEE